MATALFTNIDLSGTPLGARANVYHSQAFSLTIAQNKLIDLLSFVLVDHANGPKWTKPYTGTNKAVFQPSAGNRHYFRVDESDGSYYADVRMFEAMTDVDTGGNETPSAGASRWYKGTSGGASASDWFIICDEQAFYFGIRFVNASYMANRFCVSFFGDIATYDAASSFLTVLASSDQTSTNYYQTGYFPLSRGAWEGAGNLYSLRGYQNTGASIKLNMAQTFPPTSAGSLSKTFITGSDDLPAPPSAVSGKVELGRSEFYQDDAIDSGIKIPIGYLPGVASPRHDRYSSYFNPGYLNLFSGTDSDYLATRSVVNSSINDWGSFLISLSNWRSS